MTHSKAKTVIKSRTESKYYVPLTLTAPFAKAHIGCLEAYEKYLSRFFGIAQKRQGKKNS